MRHRIRAAAIVTDGDSVLLVQHQHNEVQEGQSWWMPPGGSVEGKESLVECALREMFEETGRSVELGRIAYVREFIEPGLSPLRDILRRDLVFRDTEDGGQSRLRDLRR